MNPRRWSIRTRTTLIASGVVCIALVIGGVGLVELLRAQLVDASRAAALARAQDVLALARTDPKAASTHLASQEESSIQLIDGTGNVIASTGDIDQGRVLSSLRPEPGEHQSRIGRVDSMECHRCIVVALTSTYKPHYTVLSVRSLDPAEEAVATVSKALLVGLPMLVLLVALLTRFVVAKALHPIVAITDEVADITDRGLGKRVPVPPSGDEIATLARSMNAMLGRLETSTNRLHRFVADASHELRSPLASARATLEVASLHPGSDADLLDAIRTVLIDHDRLDRITVDLLTLAKLDDGRVAVHFIPTSIDAMVAELISRRAEGSLTLQGSAGVISTDTHMVERICTNLLDNAARHRRSVTLINLTRADGFATVSIEDDGPGIPSADRERIFEAFVRLDEARVADSGNGLGLAITRELVKALGGEIGVDDSSLGGARFEVRLPL